MTVISIPTAVFFTAYDPRDFTSPLFDVTWMNLSAASVEEVHFCFDQKNLYHGQITANKVNQWDYRTDLPVSLGQFSLPVSARGLCHDGRHFWLVSQSTNQANQFDFNGNSNGTFAVKAGSYGLDTDGRYLYVVSQSDNTVNWYDPSTGTLIGSFAGSAKPISITVDGRFLWVLDSTGKLFQYDGEGNLIGTHTPPFGVAAGFTFQSAFDVKFNQNDRFFYFTYTGIIGA